MLKTRVIPVLLLKGSSVVKTISFCNPRMIGDAVVNVKVFSSRMADELVIVDIDANKNNRINLDLIKRLSHHCNMPLSIGGGIRTLLDADNIFRSGADKVIINSQFYKNKSILTEISDKYGKQAVIFSLDVMLVDDEYKVVSNSGSTIENISPIDAVESAVNSGCGEILLNSVDKDGCMTGYDLNLIEMISNSVEVPVIAAGGCGNKDDCVKAIEAGASAVSAGSLFHWVGESIITVKEHMDKHNIEVRLV